MWRLDLQTQQSVFGFTEIKHRYDKYYDLKTLHKFSKLFQKNTVMKYLLGIFILLILFFNPNHSHSSTEKKASSWTNFPRCISPLQGKGNEWHGNYLVLNFSSLATYKKGFKSQKVIFKLVYLNICFYSQLFKDLKAKPNRFHSTIILAKGPHWWPKMVWPCLVEKGREKSCRRGKIYGNLFRLGCCAQFHFA